MERANFNEQGMMSKLKNFILVILLSFYQLSYAAGPVSHIVLGEEWLAHRAPQYTEDEKKLFLLGTLFPDIRYLGTLKREDTHFKNVTLERVQKEPSAFRQGMLFHSFVDEFREKWVKSHHIENKLKHISDYHQRGTFLKLIEDQILYSTMSWGKFCQCLMTIPAEERAYGVDDKTLTEWHTALTFYFAASPSVLLTQIGLFEKDFLNIKAVEIKKWGILLPEYAEDEAMRKHVTGMMAAFKKVIEKPEH